MQACSKESEVAKQKPREVAEIFHELKRQGVLPAVDVETAAVGP